MYSKATKIQSLDKDNGSVYSQDAAGQYFNGEPIKQVSCGKFHSLFLTESGKVFSVGFNKYG